MTKEGILSILLVKRAERSDIHNSSIVIRHSMKFHTSGAAGLNSGQSDQKRNFEKANIEYRIMNIEC